ncbi:hypothetical protein GTP56_11130 [Duganella sp. FT134W]|uniref:Uncharacterized protein n=1 Tax=Duganella margarita TaxID=2692170 RepID=A0A7X4GZY9_9BURK|nr:hypothetical protein [Duganella margarita]MYM72750.1 hypothetical protein [Duganella margarita]
MSTLQFPTRLPADLLVELGELTGIRWNSWELEPIICDAIRRYMHPPAAPAQEQTSTTSGAGYQWKQVYLPEGTRLRASFGGQPYFATVTGTEIKSGDLTLTPSGFANLHGSGNRNAWKAVWLRFPGNEQWVLADVCRAKQKAAIARLFAGADYVAAEPPAAASRSARPSAQRVAVAVAATKGRKQGRKHGKAKKHGRRGARPAGSTA